MLLHRRSLINSLLAMPAPFIIRTPGLLMPVKNSTLFADTYQNEKALMIQLSKQLAAYVNTTPTPIEPAAISFFDYNWLLPGVTKTTGHIKPAIEPDRIIGWYFIPDTNTIKDKT